MIEYIKAFLVGGALCALGQILIDRTKLTPARILTGFVVLGVVLGAVGLYQPLADWAGAGATVPLTGFGNVLAKGVKKAVEERGILGAFTGGFTASAGGITAAMVFGYLTAVIFRPGFIVVQRKASFLSLSTAAVISPSLYRVRSLSFTTRIPTWPVFAI